MEGYMRHKKKKLLKALRKIESVTVNLGLMYMALDKVFGKMKADAAILAKLIEVSNGEGVLGEKVVG
jgi:hypothetical protein